MYIMEIAELDLIYAFVVHWNDVSRGVFLAEFFPTLETCMTYLQSWSYDPNQVNLKCIQIFPD
jgi:hypothetical protein